MYDVMNQWAVEEQRTTDVLFGYGFESTHPVCSSLSSHTLLKSSCYHIQSTLYSIVKHERQMDPTEIIAVPYDLERLAIYTAVVVFAAIVIREPVEAWPTALWQWGQRTFACFGLFVLCGASPYEKLVHTLLAAAYFAMLCWCDAPVFSATTTTQRNASSMVSLNEQLQQRLRARHHHHSMPQQAQKQCLLQTIVLYACIACTIPLQILLLYDRGWQLQRWPIPVILGVTIGWVAGTVFGTLVLSSSLNRVFDRFLFDTKKSEDDKSSSK